MVCGSLPFKNLKGIIFLHAGLLSVVLLGLVGCGDSKSGNVVEGTVTLGGAPLARGGITFISQSDDKKTATTGIEENGHYRMIMAPLGPVKVQFQAPTPSSDPKGSPPAKLPPKYLNAASSGQTYQVTKGKQTKNFDLAP